MRSSSLQPSRNLWPKPMAAFGGAREGGDCSLRNFHWFPLVAGVSRLPSKPHPTLGWEGWHPHLEPIAADATQHREGGLGLDGSGGGGGRGGGCWSCSRSVATHSCNKSETARPGFTQKMSVHDGRPHVWVGPSDWSESQLMRGLHVISWNSSTAVYRPSRTRARRKRCSSAQWQVSVLPWRRQLGCSPVRGTWWGVWIRVLFS